MLQSGSVNCPAVKHRRYAVQKSRSWKYGWDFAAACSLCQSPAGTRHGSHFAEAACTTCAACHLLTSAQLNTRTMSRWGRHNQSSIAFGDDSNPAAPLPSRAPQRQGHQHHSAAQPAATGQFTAQQGSVPAPSRMGAPGSVPAQSSASAARLGQWQRKRQQFLSGQKRQPEPAMPGTARGSGSAHHTSARRVPVEYGSASKPVPSDRNRQGSRGGAPQSASRFASVAESHAPTQQQPGASALYGRRAAPQGSQRASLTRPAVGIAPGVGAAVAGRRAPAQPSAHEQLKAAAASRPPAPKPRQGTSRRDQVWEAKRAANRSRRAAAGAASAPPQGAQRRGWSPITSPAQAAGGLHGPTGQPARSSTGQERGTQPPAPQSRQHQQPLRHQQGTVPPAAGRAGQQYSTGQAGQGSAPAGFAGHVPAAGGRRTRPPGGGSSFVLG